MARGILIEQPHIGPRGGAEGDGDGITLAVGSAVCLEIKGDGAVALEGAGRCVAEGARLGGAGGEKAGERDKECFHVMEGVFRLLDFQADNDAAVLGTVLFRGIFYLRVALAVAEGDEFTSDTVGTEPLADGEGAAFGEFLIVFGFATVAGVAFHDEGFVGEVGEGLGDLAELVFRMGIGEVGGIELEADIGEREGSRLINIDAGLLRITICYDVDAALFGIQARIESAVAVFGECLFAFDLGIVQRALGSEGMSDGVCGDNFFCEQWRMAKPGEEEGEDRFHNGMVVSN